MSVRAKFPGARAKGKEIDDAIREVVFWKNLSKEQEPAVLHEAASTCVGS